jgi:hypothetical protein
MTRVITGAIVAAVLLIGGSAPGTAQTLTGPNQTGVARPAARAPAKKPAKPAAPAQRVSSPAYDGNEPGRLSDYWTIEKALPGRTSDRVTRAREADVTPGISRVPMQNGPGTLGVASGSIRSSEFYDGRPVPGITQNSYDNSSYVGLSISAPSDNKSFPLFAPPTPSWNGGSNGW